MQQAEKYKLINDQQYGGRNRKQCQSAILNKIAYYDLSRQTIMPCAFLDADTKACYDRIVHRLSEVEVRKWECHTNLQLSQQNSSTDNNSIYVQHMGYPKITSATTQIDCSFISYITMKTKIYTRLTSGQGWRSKIFWNITESFGVSVAMSFMLRLIALAKIDSGRKSSIYASTFVGTNISSLSKTTIF